MTESNEFITRLVFDDTGTKKAEVAFANLDEKFIATFNKFKSGGTIISESVENFTKKIGKNSEECIRKIVTFQDAYGNMAKTIQTLNSKQQTIDFKASGLDKFGLVSENVVRSAQVMNNELGKYQPVSENIVRQATLMNNTLGQYVPVSDNVVRQATVMNKQFDQGALSLKEVQGQTKGTIISLGNYYDALKRVAIVVPVWGLVRFAMQSVTTTIKEGLKFLVEWETKMAEIKIVGQGTADQYQILSRSLLQLSIDLGVSSAKIAEGAKLYAQAGYELSAIIPLMETTSKISLLTGRSISDSVEDVISLMKNYKIEAQDTGLILDKLVSVELKHAVTTKDLVESLRLVAPVATQANISLERMLGIITASVVATRRAGSEVARSWITILNRMGTISIEAIQQIAQIPVYVDATGKATRENTGILRSAIEVLDEMALSWGSLTEAQQKNLARSVAGIRQSSVFVSAMQQWKEGIDAAIESMNAFNKGQVAVDILLETTKTKLEQTQNAWNNLLSEIVDTGAIKGSLEALKNVLVAMALVGKNAGAKEAIVGQFALNEEIKNTNQYLLMQIDNTKNAQQLSNSIISLLEIRNRKLAEGVALESKEMQGIEEVINKMTSTLATNKGIVSFSEILKKSYTELVSYLKSKENDVAEAIFSTNAQQQVKKRFDALKNEAQTLFQAVNQAEARVSASGTRSRFGISSKLSDQQITKLKELYESEVRAKEERGSTDADAKNYVKIVEYLNLILKKREEIAKFNVGKEIQDEEAKLKLQKEEAEIKVKQISEINKEIDSYEALTKKGYTQLEIEKKKLEWYEKQNEVDQENSKINEESLKRTIAKLEIEKQSSDVLKKQEVQEKAMVELGYSQLDIAISRLAFLKEQQYSETAIEEQQRRVSELQQSFVTNLRKEWKEFGFDIERIMGVNQIKILEQQVSLATTQEEKLKARLELEKEITKQKYGQAQFTDREQKLYEISLKYGKQVANDIEKVFQGGVSLEELLGSEAGQVSRIFSSRGFSEKEGGADITKIFASLAGLKTGGFQSQTATVFKEFFGDVLKNLQIQEFFKQNPNLQTSPAETVTNAIAKASIDVKIKDINFNVNLDTVKFKQAALDAFGKALDNPSNDIYKKIEGIIEKY